MEKIILNGIFVDKFTNFRKVLVDMNINDMEIIKFDNNKFVTPSLKIFFQTNCVKNISDKKINQSLAMVGLNEKKINDDPFMFSDSDKYKLLIAMSLINNRSNYILVYPNLYLDDYNVNLILKILKKISREYGKNICIITNNIDLLYRECDNLIIYNKNKIIYNDKRNYLYNFKETLLNNSYPLPKILEFIFLVEKKQNIKLEPTFDLKELMKDIYRNV